jgi:hypothetical protein
MFLKFMCIQIEPPRFEDRRSAGVDAAKTQAVGMRVRWHPQPPRLCFRSVVWILIAGLNKLSSIMEGYIPIMDAICRKNC